MILRGPTISAIIPAFNRQATIGRAVRSALRQTLEPLEILVVDDCSTDETCATVEALSAADSRVRLIRCERNRGGAAARNAGILEAVGELVAFLDSDDEWLTDHLERKVALIQKEPYPALVFGSFYIYDGRTKLEQRCLPFAGDPLEYLFFGHGGQRTSTFVGVRTKVMEVMFDDRLRKHQDWDLVINLMQRFTVVADAEPTAILHTASPDRLSARHDHEASQEFYRKNRRHGSQTAWVLFATIMLERTFRTEGRGPNFAYYLDFLKDLDRRARECIGALTVLLYVPRIGSRVFRSATRIYCHATVQRERRAG